MVAEEQVDLSRHGVEKEVSGWTDKYSIIHNGWKFIHTPAVDREELYHLESDPGELTDRLADEPAIAEALREQLAAWRDRTVREHSAARIEMDQEALRMMEELGYVSKKKP